MPTTKKSHKKGRKVDSYLALPAKLLPRQIKFHEARNPINAHAPRNKGMQVGLQSKSNLQHSQVQVAPIDDFDHPSRYLFPLDGVAPFLTWREAEKIGGGLHNLGNTCFLNSVLQVLLYTPPLVQYLRQHPHKKKCRMQGFCFLCFLEALSKACHRSQSPVSPNALVANLRSLSKTFRKYRQEDAHELLRFGLEALQKNWLSIVSKNFKKLPSRVQETGFISQTFGGYFRSQVECQRCRYQSNT